MKLQQALKFQGRTVTKETSIFLQKGNILKKHTMKSKLEVAENLREPVGCPRCPGLLGFF